MRFGSMSAVLVRMMPSGSPELTYEDTNLIRIVQKALHAIHSSLLDCILISKSQYLSAAAHNLMGLSYD